MPEASPEEQAETTAAIKLLAKIIFTAGLLWLVVSAVVVRSEKLREYGRSERNHELLARGGRRMYNAHHAAQSLDRDKKYGDRPVVWLLGSSITRESFDASVLRIRLRGHGIDVGVEKYAFDRGAPFFSWAMLDGLDVRPGDTVVTSISYDNFREDWLNYYGPFDLYLNYLPQPHHMMGVESLPLASRLEHSLSAAAPFNSLRLMPQFRDGLEGWIQYYTYRDTMPTIEPAMPFTVRDEVNNFRKVERFKLNHLHPSDVHLDPSQIHYKALAAWHQEVLDAGARPLILMVPPSPEYFPRFLDPSFDQQAFHEHIEANFPPYRVLAALPQNHYTDYKHPNNEGRPLHTKQLIGILKDWDNPGPAPQPPEVAPYTDEEVQVRRRVRNATKEMRKNRAEEP